MYEYQADINWIMSLPKNL